MVEGSKIIDVGEGEPPSDYLRADIILPGGNRLLAPGLAVPLAHLTLYPLRSLIGYRVSFRKAWEKALEIPHADAVSIATVAIKDLIEDGVTSIVSLDPNPKAVLDAMREVGVDGYVVRVDDWPQKDVEVNENVIDGSMSELGGGYTWVGSDKETIGAKWKGAFIAANHVGVGNYECVGVGHHWSFDSRVLISILKKGVIEAVDYEKLSVNALKLIYGGNVGVAKGAPANLVGLGVYEAPYAEYGDYELIARYMISPISTPRVELVISRGSIIVDAGQPLSIERSKVARAWRATLSLLSAVSR